VELDTRQQTTVTMLRHFQFKLTKSETSLGIYTRYNAEGFVSTRDSSI